ncbi:MAG: hypothetical protein HC915_16045 [Anaerolineae bacterium]|nr:hypothetical protein [Anaerolineae bacterium]
MRVANAFKRVARTNPDWLVPYFDRFLSEIAQIDQPCTPWTLAQRFHALGALLKDNQRQRARRSSRPTWGAGWRSSTASASGPRQFIPNNPSLSQEGSPLSGSSITMK